MLNKITWNWIYDGKDEKRGKKEKRRVIKTNSDGWYWERKI